MKSIQISNRNVEKVLETILVPVEPRPEFREWLRVRLRRPESYEANSAQVKRSQHVILMVASIASSAFLLIAAIRTVMSLVGLISVLRLLKRQAEQKRLSSTGSPA